MALELLIQAYDSDDTAEAGTTTTNITMTGHGLAVGDMIINSTRNSTPPNYDSIASRRVDAVPDVDNVTVQAVTDQTSGDTIKKFIHVDKVSLLFKGSLSIRRKADYKSETNFTIVGSTSYIPRVGQDVIIKYDSTIVFGGIIKSIKRRLAAENNTTLLYECYCTGYNDIPSRRTVTNRHDDTDAGTLVEYYVDNYLYQEGISKGTINTGATINEYDAVCKSIKEILDDLSIASGFKWYINDSKELYFLQDDTPAAAAHDLDTGSFTDFRDVVFDETLDQYRNKQFIRGGIGDDGYMISTNDTYATEVTNRQDIEGTSGYYGNVLWDSTIDNDTDAGTVIVNLLKKYGKELPSTIAFDTGQVDFVPGTKLTVNLSQLSISTSYFLIEDVEIYDLDGKNLRSRVLATLRNNSDFSSQKTDDYINFFDNLVRAAKEGGANSLSIQSMKASVKSYHASNTAAITVTTAATSIVSETFSLDIKSDVFIWFSTNIAPAGPMQYMAQTDLTEAGGSAVTQTFAPKKDTSGCNAGGFNCYSVEELFNYSDQFEGISAGSTTIEIKMTTSNTSASICQGYSTLGIICVPTLSLTSTGATGATAAYCCNGFTTAVTITTEQFTPSSNSWAAMTDTPSPHRGWNRGSSINGYGYIYNGRDTGGSYYQDCDQYDSSGDSWTSKTDTPSPARAQHAASTILKKGYIYCGTPDGGSTKLQDCDEYDASGDSWASKTSTPAPARWNLAASTISDKGYIYCGYGTSYLQDCDEYDSSGNSWTSKTDAPAPGRFYLFACTILNKGYIFGGRDSSMNYLQDCDEYNSSGNSWASKTNIPSPGRWESSAATVDNRGYLMGGYNSSRIADCDEYNASSDSYTSKSDKTTAVYDHASFEL